MQYLYNTSASKYYHHINYCLCAHVWYRIIMSANASSVFVVHYFRSRLLFARMFYFCMVRLREIRKVANVRLVVLFYWHRRNRFYFWPDRLFRSAVLLRRNAQDTETVIPLSVSRHAYQKKRKINFTQVLSYRTGTEVFFITHSIGSIWILLDCFVCLMRHHIKAAGEPKTKPKPSTADSRQLVWKRLKIRRRLPMNRIVRQRRKRSNLIFACTLATQETSILEFRGKADSLWWF